MEEGADEPTSEEKDDAGQEPPAKAHAPVDLNCLEEDPPVGADLNQTQVVTNLVDNTEKLKTSQALREELHDLAEDLQRRKRDAEEGRGDRSTDELSAVLPAELWGKLRSVTAGLSQRLCEQLRLVLEPMVATKLQGDYRSGKRINMRRVIPYIASGFRKDKIWLRRTKPAKRDYQVCFFGASYMSHIYRRK